MKLAIIILIYLMIYSFNKFNENEVATEILSLKSKQIQVNTGNSTSRSRYVQEKYQIRLHILR